MCKHAVIITMLCSICLTQAQSVALSGVVKLSNGAPVQGVTVSLNGFSSLSTLTKEDGTFSLKKNDAGGVKSVPLTRLSRDITLQGNSILFTSADLHTGFEVRVYTGDGRIIISRSISARSAENNRITLPLLGSGVYFLAVKTGKKEIIRPLLQVGSKLYCENGTIAPAGSGTIPEANKKADGGCIIDTLIAVKDGYKITEQPLTGYEQEGIEVILEPEDSYSGSILNLTVEPNPNSAISAFVKWTTDKPASSEVQFGEGDPAFSISDDSTVTNHCVLVIGMHAKTKYRIRAISGKAQAETSFTTGTLPTYIPEGSVKNSAGSLDGWTLVNVMRGTGQSVPFSNSPEAAVMYDHDGRVVWYRVHGTKADKSGGPVNADFIEEDNTVIVGPTDVEPPREYDLAGNILWEGPLPASDPKILFTHHVDKLSNGHYLLLGWNALSGPRPANFSTTGLAETILWEVTIDNKVVWEWHLADHITFPANASGDYAHGNSATVFPEKNEVYVNTRFLGLIKTTYNNPSLIYRIPASYHTATSSNDLSFSPPQSQFSDAHDPEIHLDDSTVIFFDNGGFDQMTMGSSNLHSRVVEYKIDESGKLATLKWEFPGTINNDSYFKNDFYIPYWGDADRLDNDNVLFTSSTMGRNVVSHLFEVTRAGEVVWDFTLPADNGMYRAQRIAPPPLVRPIRE